jgi:8-oxo-dGTP diphosphatase
MSKDSRFKVYTATYLVLIRDKNVLLLKRANTDYQDGNYSLVAGHFEEGETAKQCMIREGLEEANIKIKADNLTIKHIMHRYSIDRTYVDFYLTPDVWEGELKNMEEDKCDELKWFPIDILPSNMVPEVKFVLDNIKNEIFYSEFGWKGM